MQSRSWLNWQNGGRPALKSRLARLSPSFFEWRGDLAGPVWVGLLLLATLIIPWPYVGFQWPLMERAVPIMWLLLAGGLLAVSQVARASWPLALLFVWAAIRAAYHHYPLRSLQVLAIFLMAGLCYAAARRMPDRWARVAAWALLVGVGWEVLLGVLNAFRVYPWMSWVHPGHVGKPMGMLTHPNYWGSFMALSLPVVWAVVGIAPALLLFTLILKTVSGGPVISASVGVAVMAWPFLGRWARGGVIGGALAAIAGTMTLHEWRLNGRSEVWTEALKEAIRWPIVGQGLGQWRQWAADFNQAYGRHYIELQAHNEPLQLWFELGLVGLAIALLWALHAGLAARVVWRAAPAAILPGPWWRWGRAPLERAWLAMVAVAAVNMLGSPVFHLAPQALIVLLALGRLQADAEALAPVARTQAVGRKPARRPRKRKATTVETLEAMARAAPAAMLPGS